ncbi:peptide ABC transporter substrate-binding protein [Intestinimonas timonensis]|uniref:peptide ABC transporter substrate-binding protein n=1 Tax=Intestinimonas timonensis TaxID=1689270 RepID=UPI0024B1A8A5|nr:peptide ABC transporter substrate-binding protein [Intestinimonas timonensis]
MKRTTRWTALLLAGAMTLSLAACGGGGEGGDGQASTTFRELYASEATTLNYLVTSQATEFELCANFVDTLIQYDEFGVAHGGLATDWTTSEDGLTWTFTLREGVKWYRSDGSEYADLTAQDFVTGLQYVCDPANDSKTFDIVSSVVKNAQEYYSGAITDPNEIGVRAVDDMTVEYTLNAPTPYFLSMLSYVCFMPVNADFLAEVGDRFGTSADTLLYNGAYICQEFNPQESQLWVKNPNYWNADNVYIERIERTYNTEANKLAPDMYKQGSVDQAKIPAELLQAWLEDDSTKDMVRPTRSSYYTYWWLFNFDPKMDEAFEPDNWKIAVNNEAFRLSIAYGIDRQKAEYPYEPYNTEANLIRTITPEGFVDYNGVDYTQMGDLAEISNTDPFNEELALQYKEQAVEELTAAGATFPIKILMPYNPATPYWGESCQIIEQQLESLLGTDYIDITVEAGPSTNFLAEVRKSGEYSLMLCNWGPDYADPETYSDPWSLGYTYSWPELTTQSDLLTGYIYTEEDMAAGVFDEEKFIGTPETVYIKMVQEGKDEKLDIEKRYTAFANAEAFLIKHAIVIPFHRQADNGYVVSDLSVFDRPFSPFGVSSYRYEGAHLLETPISMDEYYAQYEQWETDRQAALEAAAAES